MPIEVTASKLTAVGIQKPDARIPETSKVQTMYGQEFEWLG